MSIKAIIFDCDGTLVDSEEHHYQAWKAAFQKQGFELDPDLYVHFAGLGDQFVLDRSLELIGSNCTAELLRDKNAHYYALQMQGVVPIAPTVEFLHRLAAESAQHGLKLAVASGARKHDIFNNLKLLGVDHYFEVILSGADDLPEYDDPEGTNKPKPYVYLKAARMLGLLPQECVAVEDSRPGVSSAVSAGCFTIAVPNLLTRQHDLSHAHWRLESFLDYTPETFLEALSNQRCTKLS